MAADLSKRVFDLFSGKKRTRWVPTLAIALVVTAAVAIPLIMKVADADPSAPNVVVAPADAGLITVEANGEVAPLDLAEVSGPLLISLEDPDAEAVSFNLFAAGGDAAVVESLDTEGPLFDLVADESGQAAPFDSSLIPNGDYELFITIRTEVEDRRTAVSFKVANP
jgi:hypothetical protein